jgi:ribonuclease Z
VDLDVLFLGTAGAVPTAQRGLAGILVRRGGDRILIDCGEGTQRQLLRSGVGLVDMETVLVTHLHADHFLGLPGLLKTLSLRGREAPLALYGPAGMRDLLRSLGRVIGRLSFPLATSELEPGARIGGDRFAIEVFATDHGVPSLGYALVEEPRPGRFDVAAARALGVPPGPLFGALQRGEPVGTPDGATVRPEQVLGEARAGRRLVFSGDTGPCAALVHAAGRADLLVHEATFMDADAGRARETGHTTAGQAGRIAAAADVKLLALTHVSTRYLPRELLAEARVEFPAAVLPRDFDAVEVPLPERGEPRLVKAGDRLAAEAAAPPPAPAPTP